MTEDELQKKRAEYRDQEVQSKIANFSEAVEYRQQVLKTNYTSRKVDTKIGKLGWVIVASQATFLVFFCSLFVLSYIPKTKFIITKIMP